MNGRKGGQTGYIFITVLVMVVILSISMGALTRSWTYRVQRMNENELLFRGKQYARAIRSFYQIHKRYPFKLEELEQTKPRLIRKLWKDPMMADGKWRLIYLDDIRSGRTQQKTLPTPGLRVVGVDGEAVEPQPEPPGEFAEDEASEESGITFSEGFGDNTGRVGQIVGVASRSRKTAYVSYQKGKVYADWRFIGIMDMSESLRRLGNRSYNPVSSKEAR